MSFQPLAPGLLIAMPQLSDPNFQRAVVLMVEHSEEGAMGLVLNRTSGLSLKEVAEGQSFPLAASRLAEMAFVGGPVEPQRGFVLHDDSDVQERKEVLPGLFFSVTLEALGPLLARRDGRMRFCLGYAGWGPQQLEAEIANGSWLYTEATAAGALEGDPNGLWDATLRGMGVNPAMIVAGGGVN